MKLEKANREAAESAQRDMIETSREQSDKNTQLYSTTAGKAGVSNEERDTARTNAVMGLSSNRLQEEVLVGMISQNVEAATAAPTGFWDSLVQGVGDVVTLNTSRAEEQFQTRQRGVKTIQQHPPTKQKPQEAEASQGFL
jgi:hypothetical protein